MRNTICPSRNELKRYFEMQCLQIKRVVGVNCVWREKTTTNIKNNILNSILFLFAFSIQSYRSCYATQHLCRRSFYTIFVKFRNSNKNVLEIVLIIVNNMQPARPWMLTHLKIIWQFHAHPVHQKVSRYIGDDFF